MLLTRRQELALVGGLLLLRFLLAWNRIDRPGLEADETIFVNAATLRIPGVYIFSAVHHIPLLLDSYHGIPTMVFPYSGALKSWLWAPVFSVLGSSPGTIRLPAVLIASVGIACTYVGVRQLLGRTPALLAFAVLLLDGSTFWLTREDVGPSAIELACKGGLLLVVAAYAAQPRRRTVLLVLAVCALGVFNKLNFMWTVDALVAISIVFAFRAYRRGRLREHAGALALWTGGLVVLFAVFMWWYQRHDLANYNRPAYDGSVLGYTLKPFLVGTNAVLSGTWFHNFALAPYGPRTPLTVALLLSAALAVGLSLFNQAVRNPVVPAIGAGVLIIAAQELVTPQANAGWHYYAIQPFVAILAASGVWLTARALGASGVRLRTVVATAAVVVLVVNGWLLSRTFEAIDRQPRNSAWSPQIYALASYLRDYPGTVVTLDWGIYNPLLALDTRPRYQERAFALQPTRLDPGARARIGAELTNLPEPKVLVSHADGREHFRAVNRNARAVFGHRLRVVHVVRDQSGHPQYVVWRLVA
jgi:4-amino-4-deoxy-L-arabinose transferase-like glycosyltransferase